MWGTHSMKKYISLFAFLLTLMACTTEEYKEAVDYKLPSITLDSCVAASDNSFTAYMTVDKGEQFFKHSSTWNLEKTVCKKFRRHSPCQPWTTNT